MPLRIGVHPGGDQEALVGRRVNLGMDPEDFSGVRHVLLSFFVSVSSFSLELVCVCFVIG